MATQQSALGNAPDELARILDRAPPVVEGALRGETRLTGPWGHGALHDTLPGLADNVIITYYGDAQDIVWRVGGDRHAGKTRSGTITIIPQAYEGRWDIAGPIGVSHVFLSGERLRESAEQLAGGAAVDLLPRVGFDDPMASRLMHMLGQEAASPDPSSRLFVEQATDLLVTQLVRGHSSYGALAAEAPRRGLADWQIRRVTDYMREHLDEEVGLAELAGLIHLSRFHFCTAFRLATGRTPHEWLMALRIQEAQRLLAVPELAVTEIALAVGYQTPSSFAAAFRKVAKMTPTEYRRRL